VRCFVPPLSQNQNLILPAKELQQVQELVEIFEPFAEATDLTQGDKTMTVSCRLPVEL
jgi:hypothetical protein